MMEPVVLPVIVTTVVMLVPVVVNTESSWITVDDMGRSGEGRG